MSGLTGTDAAPRAAAEHVAYGLALWTLEGEGCGREELAMRLYRFADDVATGGKLWCSAVEYARELTKARRSGVPLLATPEPTP